MAVPEEIIGISVFLTEGIEGIGGRLKTSADDFVVEEMSIFPPEIEGGKFTIAQIRHKNWEMNRLIRRLGSNLHIGRNRIGFAGTKDKRSIATQLMSFQAPLDEVRSITIPDVDILKTYSSNTEIRLGALLGNRFDITVREIEKESALERSEMVAGRFAAIGGFPNFFGVQRFGVTRPVTHLMGKAMVHGDFEKAVMYYLAEDTEYEAPECTEARKFVAETRDFQKALEIFPSNLTFERMILAHLSKNPEDYSGAIGTLPKNLVMMFVHAYQSFLFNRILSLRIESKIPLNVASVGDIVLPLDKNGLPDHRRYIAVTEANVDRANEQISAGKGFVSGLVFGSDPIVAEGDVGEIERKVISAEKLDSKDFIIPEILEASSKGMRRELVSSVRNLKFKLDDDQARFTFELNKGCYATSLLREFMKSPLIAY